MFFGRDEHICELIKRRIQLNPPVSTILLGGRSIGKTLLLYQIQNRLIDQVKKESNDSIIPVYVNLGGIAGINRAIFFAHLIEETIKSIKKIGLNISGETELFVSKIAATDSYHKFLDQMSIIFYKYSRYLANIKFLFLIDEAERLLGHCWSTDILSNLRELINTSDLSQFVSIIITGFRELHESTMIEGRDGSILGNAVYWSYLNVLSYEESKKLITEPLKGEIGKDIIKLIYNLSGGHPFIIQYLMQRIWKSIPSDITINDVEIAVKEFQKHIKVFWLWDKKFKELDREIYKIISEEKEGVLLEKIKDIANKIDHNLSIGVIEDSLNFLYYTGVIKKRDDLYFYAGQLYKNWFFNQYLSQRNLKIKREQKKTNTITWLHLSDIHYCKEESGWDSEKIFEDLVADLKQMEKDYNLEPDLLFLTGDIAKGNNKDKNWNLKDQYKGAQSFIERVCRSFNRSILKENIFIVPGNHDVDRNVVIDWATEWIDKQNIEKILNMIKSNDQRCQDCMKRLHGYQTFLKEFNYNHLLDDSGRMVYSISRDINGLNIGIGGFNSVWNSCRCSENERGKLKIGSDWQLKTIKSNINHSDVSIALIHHPPSCFVKEESHNFKIKLQENFNFFLHGHEHSGWVDQSANGNVTISAAACYNRLEKNGYNFVKIDFEKKDIKVWLREYDNSGIGGWIPKKIFEKTDNDGLWNLGGIEWMKNVRIT